MTLEGPTHTAHKLFAVIFLFAACTLFTSGAPILRRGQSRAQPNTITRQLRVAAPQPGESRYAYVPFTVPAGASRVSVSYEYDRAGGANTIDLGLFDGRFSGRDDDGRGFRGWSGGRRATIFVARHEATPGYIPGELPAGTWHVILGLYRVAPQGVDVSFTFTVETNPDAPTNIPDAPRILSAPPPSGRAFSKLLELAPGQPSPARPAQRQWFRGDLHAHTLHSDGDWTVAQLACAARQAGLDFISITDHNTLSHHADIARLPSDGALVLRGEEVTTYGGHVNAWGLPANTLIDFRVQPGDGAQMSKVVGKIHGFGALASINHPFALCGGCSWSYDRAARSFDSIEVWNGAWDQTDERALQWWDELLRGGRRITAIGSSDTHRPANPLGHPTTHVFASDVSREEPLLQAIREGRVIVTSEPARPMISFTVEAVQGKARIRHNVGEELALNTAGLIRFRIAAQSAPDGAIAALISQSGELRRFVLRPNREEVSFEHHIQTSAYFRVEVRDRTGGMLAFTNPIYVSIKPPRSSTTGRAAARTAGR